MNNKLEFYHSKGKLFIGVIFSLLFVALGVFMVYISYVEESLFMLLIGLFTSVLLGFFTVGNFLKLVRGYPYLTLTDDYIQLDTATRSEVTIYFTDIDFIKVSQVSFQGIIEIVLYDEDDYFTKLSFHNKVRLFMNRFTGFSLFTISPKAVPKQERPRLLEVLDTVIQEKTSGTSPLQELGEEQLEEKEFLEKYDPTSPVDRSIDRSYFLKAYKHSLFIFVLAFVLFYLLISRDETYLLYIVVSGILYPFAKVLVDWMIGFKLRNILDKQKGATFYLGQLRMIFDLILFHVSLFVAPVGIIFLLIHFMVTRMKR